MIERPQGPLEVARIRETLGSAARSIQASEATLWWLISDASELVAAVNFGSQRQVVEGAVVPVAESVVGMIAATGLPSTIGSDDPHHPLIDRLTGSVTRCMAAVPLRVKGEVVGVVSAVNSIRNGFDATDLLQLEACAAQIESFLEAG